MKKITSLFTLICALFITTATAQVNQTVVFDFATNAWGIPTYEETNYSGVKSETELTDGTNTITINPTANKGSFYYDSDCLRLQKTGSKIVLPAFNFAVEKIEVVGHSKASSYKLADINIYVGGNAVSTETAGITDSHVYEIAAESQAAGTIYEVVVGNGGGNYSSIVYITYIKVYPAASDNALTLEAPVFDNGTGVYTGPVTVKVSSPTTEIEGVEDVYYYYTTDGYEPDAECDEIKDGTIVISESCTLKVVLEFTYEGNTYTSESSSAEYIISEEVTYGKATTVTTGNYFIAANGNIALPFSNGVLPTKATVIANDCVTDAAYYAYSIEEDGNGNFYIKDANNLYLTASSMSTKDEIKTTTTTDFAEWSIDIEDGVAKIRKEGYVLVYKNNTIAAIKEENASTTEIYPSLYSVIEIAAEPITATISPSAPVSTIWGDGDVTIAFNKAVEYTAPEAGIQLVDANNEVVCNVSSLIFNGAKTSAFVMLDGSINQSGTYTITFPAGAFTSEDGAVSEEMTFTLTIEGASVPEPAWWTDYDYTAVTKEFSSLTISFDNLTEIKLNDANATWLFTSNGDEFPGTAEIVETVDEKEGKTTTNIVITFGETFTNEGTYYINIPAGMFTMNGSFNNEEKNLQFRINAPVDVAPLEIVSVTPAIGEVGQIESIIITYNQEIGCAYDETWHLIGENINLVDAEGNVIILTQTGNYFLPLNQIEYAYLGEEPQMNSNWYYQAVPITAAGTYTLDASQIIVNYGYDAAAYEYNAQGAAKGTFTWTIAETGIDSIEAEAENAEIYDLTGRKVEKITKAGIYIVNGVKKIVK